jgi:hypothetical protein
MRKKSREMPAEWALTEAHGGPQGRQLHAGVQVRHRQGARGEGSG